MTPVQETLISDLPELAGFPLEDAVDDEVYERIMRRLGIAEGEPGTSVSAFNSSI